MNTDMQKVHDRRSTDDLRNRQIHFMEVDDPFEPGTKIMVSRQLRHDQLAWLHAHRKIDQAQYEAGRLYQRDWELAEQGAQAIDPTKECVDGGGAVDPLPSRQMSARNKLVAIERVLGRQTVSIVQAVLIRGAKLHDIAPDRRKSSKEFVSRLFRAALEQLAVEYRLTHRKYHERRKIDQGEMVE